MELKRGWMYGLLSVVGFAAVVGLFWIGTDPRKHPMPRRSLWQDRI